MDHIKKILGEDGSGKLRLVLDLTITHDAAASVLNFIKIAKQMGSMGCSRTFMVDDPDDAAEGWKVDVDGDGSAKIFDVKVGEGSDDDLIKLTDKILNGKKDDNEG